MSETLDIEKEKQAKGIRFSTSVVLPALATWFISQREFNEDIKSILLALIAATPLGIDNITKKILIFYNEQKLKKEFAIYENDVRKMANDKSIPSKQRGIYITELERLNEKKLKTHRIAVSGIENTLENLRQNN